MFYKLRLEWHEIWSTNLYKQALSVDIYKKYKRLITSADLA